MLFRSIICFLAGDHIKSFANANNVSTTDFGGKKALAKYVKKQFSSLLKNSRLWEGQPGMRMQCAEKNVQIASEM